jgi:hypothetical protein
MKFVRVGVVALLLVAASVTGHQVANEVPPGPFFKQLANEVPPGPFYIAPANVQVADNGAGPIQLAEVAPPLPMSTTQNA